MKNLTLILTLVVAGAAWAQTPIVPPPAPLPSATDSKSVAPPTNPFTQEFEAGIAQGVLTLEMQALYAPRLADKWGAEISLSHPVTDYAGIGVSAMLLNGGYYAGTFGVEFKKAFNLKSLIGWDTNITPRVRTGAYVPFKTLSPTDPNANASSTNSSLGGFVETGAQLQLWHHVNAAGVTDAEFAIGGGVKYITTFSGPAIQTYDGFGAFTVHF